MRKAAAIAMGVYAALVAIAALVSPESAESTREALRPIMRVGLFAICAALVLRGDKLGWWLSVISCGFYGAAGLLALGALMAAGALGELDPGYVAFLVAAAAALVVAFVLLLLDRR